MEVMASKEFSLFHGGEVCQLVEVPLSIRDKLSDRLMVDVGKSERGVLHMKQLVSGCWTRCKLCLFPMFACVSIRRTGGEKPVGSTDHSREVGDILLLGSQ